MNPKIDMYLVSYKVSSVKNVFDTYPIPNLLADLSQPLKQRPIKDTEGKTYSFLVLVDAGADFTNVLFCPGHSAKVLAQVFIDQWVAWAGPPD